MQRRRRKKGWDAKALYAAGGDASALPKVCRLEARTKTLTLVDGRAIEWRRGGQYLGAPHYSPRNCHRAQNYIAYRVLRTVGCHAQ